METLLREQPEMRSRNLRQEFLGGGPLRSKVGRRAGIRPIFLDQGGKAFLAEFPVVKTVAENGGDVVEDGGRPGRGGGRRREGGSGGSHRKEGVIGAMGVIEQIGLM